MKLPQGFGKRRISKANLELLNDDEVCTDAKVWRDLLREEGLPATMENVLAWIEPMPRGDA